MIRVFKANEKDFSTNGDIIITPLKARVFNSDNGDFYLDLICSYDYNDFLKDNYIIVCPTPQGEQAFRIKEIVKIKNKIEVKAWHVFYDSSNYLIADAYAVDATCKEALVHFNAALDNPSPFKVDSNINTIHNYRCVRKSFTECISEVLDRWGGHLYRDNFTFKILNEIGKDNGLTIAYKKNLKELSATYNWDNVVTKLMPVGKDGILLVEKYVYSKTQYDIPFTHCLTFEQDINEDDYKDASGEINETLYQRALRADLKRQAQKYVNANCIPNVNYSLKSTPDIPVNIGDTIEVKDERIGVDILTKVISYEYDAIMEKYKNLEFGNFNQQTLSNLFTNINKDIDNTINNAVGGITASINSLDNNVAKINKYISSFDIKGGHNIDVSKTGNVYTLDGGTRVITGQGVPTTQGLDGDIYLDIDLDEVSIAYDSANVWENVSISESGGKYEIITEGNGVNDLEYVAYTLSGLTIGRDYTVKLTAQMSSDATFYNESYGYGVTIQDGVLDRNYSADGGVYVPSTRTMGFYRDTQSHNYEFTFTADAETMFFNFQYGDVRDGTDNTLTVTDLSITDVTGGINAVYFKNNGLWLKDETGGNVEANPTGTPTETLNTISINDVIYQIEGSGGGAGETLIDVLLDTPESTSAWASPILVSCNPLDYDLITFEVLENVQDARPNLLMFAPYSVNIDSSITSDTFKKAYKLSDNGKAYLSRTADAVGLWTNTGTTLTLNKVVGYRFSVPIHRYSANEQVIGTWVDGATIYEKTFSFTIDNTETTLPNTTDIDKLIKGFGSLGNSNNSYNFPYADSADYASVVYQSGVGAQLIVSSWFVSNAADCVITIQYTKTN